MFVRYLSHGSDPVYRGKLSGEKSKMPRRHQSLQNFDSCTPDGKASARFLLFYVFAVGSGPDVFGVHNSVDIPDECILGGLPDRAERARGFSRTRGGSNSHNSDEPCARGLEILGSSRRRAGGGERGR